MTRRIHPVILSGGAGHRLWPLSRHSLPKQFLPLLGRRTMLQETVLRVLSPVEFAPPTVIGNVDHRFMIAEQMREAGAAARIVLEPEPRNTAAAVAAVAVLLEPEPDAVMLVMPADHALPDSAAFGAAVQSGRAAADRGDLVLFGVRPTSPETGYGYIELGKPLDPHSFAVETFVEKPDVATALDYVASGRHLWNSGIFLLPVQALLAEMQRLAPEVLAGARAAVAGGRDDLDFFRLDAGAFAACPSISLDKALFEKTAAAVVVPASFTWSDVGAWSELWRLGARDADDNVRLGSVVLEASRGCYLRSEGPVVAALGVEDLIVVATPDAVLVASKSADQGVRQLVEQMKGSSLAGALESRRIYRPWGWYESLHEGERFQVKRLTVQPGGKLSLQRHVHRAEHWVVVNGTGEVTVDNETKFVGENESIYIPLGAAHRLSNPGKVPLNVIEVQSGPYLGEDDIVRLEDAYART